MAETITSQEASPREPAKLRAVNPASGETLSILPVHDEDAVRATVEQARRAASWWSALSWSQRERHLLRWARELVRRGDEIVELMHAENGKPRDDAYLELALALEHLRWAAKNAGRVLRPRRVPSGLFMANHAASVEYRPCGVVGVIGPWNYPIYTPNGSIAYALAAGNTVVFKPSEHSSATGKLFVEAFSEANPDAARGVLSVLTGYGETGASLCGSGVDKVAFTGSPATGRKVMAECARTLTPVLMECGGKDALIVAEDADLTAAAEAAIWGAMANSGQTCAGVERVYVARPVRDEFLAELRFQLDGVRPGADKDAAYGPMTMPGQVDVVQRHIADALERGAAAVVGGTDSVREPFVYPVVLLDAPEDSVAVREETFGPTITVRAVDTMDEAVELANASEYGLAASVFSHRHGMEIARRIDSGATSVNSVLGFAGIPALPFGGQGESGFGRIHGDEGLRGFAVAKSIARRRFTFRPLEVATFQRRRVTMPMVRMLVRFRHGRRV